MTPITCHLPGTAWQNVCTRSFGSTTGLSANANTTPEVPTVDRYDSRLDDAVSDRARGLVAAAADYRRARRKPGVLWQPPALTRPLTSGLS